MPEDTKSAPAHSTTSAHTPANAPAGVDATKTTIVEETLSTPKDRDVSPAFATADLGYGGMVNPGGLGARSFSGTGHEKRMNELEPMLNSAGTVSAPAGVGMSPPPKNTDTSKESGSGSSTGKDTGPK